MSVAPCWLGSADVFVGGGVMWLLLGSSLVVERNLKLRRVGSIGAALSSRRLSERAVIRYGTTPLGEVVVVVDDVEVLVVLDVLVVPPADVVVVAPGGMLNGSAGSLPASSSSRS